MSDDKPPRSMREFDYFSEGARPAVGRELGAERELPEGLEEQLRLYRQAQRRQSRHLLLALLALGVSLWFLWGYGDWMRYVFSPARPALELGDVTRLEPAQIPVNAYVSISGITEHRGLTQKMVRGLGLDRQELWYFRLLGSRGVFIEVEPDTERWGFATAVRVSGRSVDPYADSSYRGLLSTYESRYFPSERVELRIIQVGVRPGEDRWPYLLAIALVSIVAVANAWVAVRIARARRDASRRGLLRA